MQLTGPIGLGIRALLSAVVTLTSMLVSAYVLLAFAAAVIVVLAMQFGPLEFTETGLFWALALSAVLVLPPFAFVIAVGIRAERRHLLEGTRSVDSFDASTRRRLEALTTQLGSQFGVATPELRIHSSSTPFAYTTYGPDAAIVSIRRTEKPTVVLSSGILEALTDDEVEAVLAHEFAHLSNDDLQLTSWLLVPLFAAEFLHDDGEKPWEGDPIGWVLASVALVGIGLFSRGRELAADRGAAVATGDPAALASALERLDGRRNRRPSTDLRAHAQSTNAINVLPTLEPDGTRYRGLRATHPPLESRLEALQSIARRSSVENVSARK